VKTRPTAADTQRRTGVADLTQNDRILELSFDVGPEQTVTWVTVEGSADGAARRRIHGIELPFDDGSVDRVVCADGFQLLPDRGRALEQVRRVLVRDGQIEVTVPGSIEENPPFAELAERLEQHSGVRGAAAIRWLFCMPEPDDLRGALAAAGFEDIRIDVVRTTGRSTSVAAFLSRSAFGLRTVPEWTHLVRALESSADQDGLRNTETIIGHARRV
jgi:SAM-dependent methyltransferase